ncbi:50S ribosomal protein L6 [Candidatus Xianfuyuplasma coldseepsis]|uniref:Large ribosomal subunit protein uL6 n=1 Tax=Candidatus Xianfuyuplasma coldseepsis TaxID=2782163 RepID=A0A7L7KR40_9MOLU|nr:50S ribosomal protein L6 [Xianfuyuplasma coldseepsis]QMS85193.1 50S ribosomal protein L6 [Xianfuyuplasma coldseepsis]
MSRIGKKPITLPQGVEVTIDNHTVTVKGPKGTLEGTFNNELAISVDNNELLVERPNDSKFMRSIHGTTRALINNMITGVSDGFKKQLKMIGVGYRAQLQGNKLVILAGYSNPVEMDIPEGITVDVPKNTDIIVSGIDKQLVGEFSANVRKVRPPEPYLGKGIRYVDEYVRRKEGKTAK